MMRRAQPVDFRALLGDVGYQKCDLILSSPSWEYWKGSYTTPGQDVEERILFLKLECGWRDLEQAIGSIIKGQFHRSFYVVVQNIDRRFGGDVERVREVANGRAVYSISNFLYQAVKRAVTRRQEIDAVRHFVQQSVVVPPEHRRLPSLDALVGWLRGRSEDGPNVAVLLAPAASGKTSLAREAFRQLTVTDIEVRIPLLVEREVWKDLLYSEKIDLIDVWRNSMAYWYPGAILGYDQLERCLSFGAICPIFDGLDELCTAFPLDINPDDTVRSLLQIFENGGSGGRLLITSRTSFWNENISPSVQSEVLQVELCPFDDLQVRAFLKKRFEGNEAAEGRALRVLHRIGSATAVADKEVGQGWLEPPGSVSDVVADRIEQVPYVAVLAAESADTEQPELLAKFGGLFSDPDPVYGLLLAICERERVRQTLSLDAVEQIRIFLELVAEFGSSTYGPEELALCCEARGHGADEIRRIRSHWFLWAHANGLAFQYPFIEDYLRARAVCMWLARDEEAPRVDEILRFCARQPGNLLDQIATLVDAGAAPDWATAARDKYCSWRFDDSSLAGFLHILVAVAKKTIGSTRKETIDRILHIVGDEKEKMFKNLKFLGSFSNLDLSGIKFLSCNFENVEFTHCTFDEHSEFIKCAFDGQFMDDNSKGFRRVKITESLRMSSAARATFSDLESAESERRINRETVEEAIRDVLRWFTRGPGFRTKREDDIRSAARRWGRFGRAVVDRLKANFVLGEVPTGGDLKLKVEDRDSVRLFLENRLVSGRILETRNSLLRKYTGDEIRPRM